MIFIYKEWPFPHYIIKNFFSDDELVNVWDELELLKDNMLPPEQTASAYMEDNKTPAKNNKGVFLDNIYGNNRTSSPILTYMRKTFSKEFISELNKNYIFNYIKNSNNDATLVSYYENGGYYLPHVDSSTITTLTHVFKEPKKFTGGELYFPLYDYEIENENNRMIIIPSFEVHGVKPVNLNPEFTGSGRYAISQFITNMTTI